MLGDPLVFILQSMISPPTYIHLPHYTCHLPHDSAALLVVFLCLLPDITSCHPAPHTFRHAEPCCTRAGRSNVMRLCALGRAQDG